MGGTEYLSLCKLKIAAESGVDMHGLIHGWSLMDVVIARRCPGLASILVGIEVTSQKTQSRIINGASIIGPVWQGAAAQQIACCVGRSVHWMNSCASAAA